MILASPIDRVAVLLIVLYQKHLSPRKGFQCAYRVRHGELSCSEYVKRAIVSHGIGRAYRLAQQRFAACKSAGEALRAEGDQKRKRGGSVD